MAQQLTAIMTLTLLCVLKLNDGTFHIRKNIISSYLAMASTTMYYSDKIIIELLYVYHISNSMPACTYKNSNILLCNKSVLETIAN